jgi:antirestriction protein
MQTTTQAPIRIYVACLASYNAGILHGAWVDVSSDVDDMQEQINDMLAASRQEDAEEWDIHDYEAPFSIDEWEGLDDLARIADLYEQHGDVFLAAVEINNEDIDYAEQMVQNFAGTYDDWEDMAIQYVEEGLFGDIPDNIQGYLDYERLGRDLSFDYSGTYIDGDLYVFRS